MRKNVVKVYHVQGWSIYSNWINNREVVKNIEDADLVIFEGGSDVSPYLYGENAHPTTSSEYNRDVYEEQIFILAQQLGKKCFGTCRGIQFLGVMSGTKLVQHQQNPSYYHNIITHDGKELEITSTHHQAVFPYNLPKDKYKILGWTENISKYHYNGNEEEMNPEKECEIMYFPETNSMGWQGHLEALNKKNPTLEYANELLDKFLNNEL